MGTFRIKGGKPLKGEINPQGAKNECLQVLCATLLTSDKIIINNIPDIIDINKLIYLLKSLGVEINKIKPNSYTHIDDYILFSHLYSFTVNVGKT
jgi:UDP-N-acetylglucosamine 1-carboxyvinyltransferase